MSLIALPAAGIVHTEWALADPTIVNRSEWTGKTQTAAGSSWRRSCTVTIALRSLAAGRPWRAFFAALRGRTNSFLLPITEGDQAGLWTGVENVNANGAVAAGVLSVPAWNGNIGGFAGTTVLKAGMFVQIGTRCYELAADAPVTVGSVVGHATGNVMTLQLCQPLATAIAADSTIYSLNPACSMRLTSDVSKWSTDNQKILTPFAFTCEEDF